MGHSILPEKLLTDVEEHLKFFFAQFFTLKKVIVDEIHAFKQIPQLFLELFFSLSLLQSCIFSLSPTPAMGR